MKTACNNRFLHNREIAPSPTWQRSPIVPLLASGLSSPSLSDLAMRLADKERAMQRAMLASYSLTRSFRLPEKLEFCRLAAEWKQETYWDSSVTQKILHPSYQQIIGMGPIAVGWILQALRHDADFWFDALTAITGEQPVPIEHAGDIQAMANDWLEWGRHNGYDC